MKRFRMGQYRGLFPSRSRQAQCSFAGTRRAPGGIAALLAIPLYVAFSPSEGVVSGQARVVDGDSLVVAGERVRLAGIDAPELSQMCGTHHCGADAATWLRNMIGDRTVTCTYEERDRYKRVLGTCSVGQTEINRAIVRYGWAVAYTRYSHAYEGEEAHAKGLGLGIWAPGNTISQTPEEYRHRRR